MAARRYRAIRQYCRPLVIWIDKFRRVLANETVARVPPGYTCPVSFHPIVSDSLGEDAHPFRFPSRPVTRKRLTKCGLHRLTLDHEMISPRLPALRSQDITMQRVRLKRMTQTIVLGLLFRLVLSLRLRSNCLNERWNEGENVLKGEK